jgi:hypothetical protein
MRWRLRVLAQADEALRAVAARRGFDLVRRSPYSPVPSIPPAESPDWGPKHSLAGIALDVDAEMEWLERQLGPWLTEPCWPRERPPAGGFFLDNGYYPGFDAAVLHAIIRSSRPRRVVEVGAGYSTMVIAAAAARNAAEGSDCEVLSIDPEPRSEDPGPDAGRVRRDRRPAAEVPLATYLALDAGDILFVDSSHTVKRGSEVNFLVLEVLPRLRPGVVAHFHDVFLPWDYPREWFLRGTYLAEQYLLHAYLAENPAWEVVLAAHAVARRHADAVRALVPAHRPGPPEPAALWLRRRQ